MTVAKTFAYLAALTLVAACQSPPIFLAPSRQLQDKLHRQQPWQETFRLCQQQDQVWRRGQTAATLAFYRRQILAAPAKSLWYFLYGRLLGLQGQITAANHFLRQALAKDPDYVWAHHGLGVLALKKQDYFQARLYFDKCLLNVPDFVPALVGMARVSAASSPRQALRYLERALLVMPQWAPLHRHIARVFLYTKQPERALQHLATAVRLLPGDKALLKELALLYFRQGDKRASAAVLRKLASLTSPGQQRRKILLLVQRLQQEFANDQPQ